ncbi:class I SAM-dependent methyltransferase [Ornithinimicrobium sp. LYQ92]|uniref:class I SAM-dependent methyltransferase n=1 Tax=Serinicoccus sp. LYQ92 TaxID=3378798 RepID=UPI0038544228
MADGEGDGEHVTRGFVRGEVDQLMRDLAAHRYLSDQLADGRFMPAGRGWAARDEAVAVMVDTLLHSTRAGNVLEVGGGQSTVWLSLALARRGSGTLFSVEHDLTYLRRTQDLVNRLGDRQVVSWCLAALESQGTAPPWYALDNVSLFRDVELLFVDGPPAHVGPKSRAPALSRLRSTLMRGATVVLDDTTRVEEREISREWEDAGLHKTLELGNAHVFVYDP